MNSWDLNALAALLWLIFINFATAKIEGTSSREKDRTFLDHSKSHLISFDSSKESDIVINWDISLPFISIPTSYEVDENGRLPSLINVHPKAFVIAGLITGISSFIVPLLSKHAHTAQHTYYRSNDNSLFGDWSQMGNAINQLIFSNNYVTPCMQNIVCSLIAAASRMEDPTSTEKIIDGLSSHKWFKNVANSTLLQDAVATGRAGEKNCARLYKDCFVTPKLLKNLMKQVGLQ